MRKTRARVGARVGARELGARELGAMGVQKRARILSSGSVSHILASQAWNQPVKMGGSAPCWMVEMGRPLRPEGSESTYSLAGRERGGETVYYPLLRPLERASIQQNLLYVVRPGT